MVGVVSHKFPQAVLFDWDNTLMDTTRVCYEALAEVLKAFGKPSQSYEEYICTPPYSVRSAFQPLFLPEQRQQAEEMFYNHVTQSPGQPFDFAEDLLKWLQSHNVPMGIVSNKKGDILRREVEAVGWTHYFYCIVGSYDTPEDKPSPLPLEHAVERSGNLECGPHIWFVGDSGVDKACAEAAGCTSVIINACIKAPGELSFRKGQDFLKNLKSRCPH